MKLDGGVLAGAAGENVGDLIMDGQKPLHLPRRLEALHDPLSSSRWLVGILRPVVEALVLAVLDAGHDLTLGGTVAAQLVSNQHTRRAALLFQQLAQQALGCFLVAPALDEDVEDKAVLVDGAPEPMLLAGDGDDDLIQMPFIAAAWGTPADAVGELPAEFQAPLPDRLVGHRDAACCQHLLNHAQAQREAEIEPHRVADELCRIAIAGINRVSGRRHPGQIPDHRQLAKPDAAQLDGARWRRSSSTAPPSRRRTCARWPTVTMPVAQSRFCWSARPGRGRPIWRRDCVSPPVGSGGGCGSPPRRRWATHLPKQRLPNHFTAR